MTPKLHFTVEEPDWDFLKKTALSKAHKEAGGDVNDYIKSVVIPARFDGSVSAELHWAERSTGYMKRKARKGISPRRHHYFTGYTARRFKAASGNVTKKSIHRQATGLNPGYKSRAPRRHPPLRNELTRFTRRELKTMAEAYGARYVYFLNEDPRARRTTRRTIRG